MASGIGALSGIYSPMSAHKMYQEYEHQRREYEMQKQWATAAFTATTTSSATNAISASWYDAAEMARTFQIGNSPGLMASVLPRVKVTAAKESTNLQWLDKRVDEMRVRL